MKKTTPEADFSHNHKQKPTIMNLKEFKSELESEMEKQGFLDDIYCITETTDVVEETNQLTKRTIIQFSFPINPQLAEWMNKWFPHGVMVLSPTVVRVNNPGDGRAAETIFPSVVQQEPFASAPASFETVMQSADDGKLIRQMADALSDILRQPLKVYECEKAYQLRKTIIDANMDTDGMDQQLINRADYYSNIVELIKKAKP